MSIVKNNVLLRHVSASDTSNTSSLDYYGASRYEITFDQSVVNLGNVIMFEYKIQDISSNMNSNFVNSTFGFIAVENATVSGISNQYILSVPASENVLNDVATHTIQFRVYAGQKVTERVVITDWSNSLNLYNPPATPNLHAAYFDPSDNGVLNNDDLYVFLNDSENPDYDYNAIKFVVCYFYQDGSTNTVWNISDPIFSLPVTIGGVAKRMIVVKNIGEVSASNLYNKVYVTAHAVYDWLDVCNNKIYALSYVSDQVTAISGSIDNKPDITDVCYNVYSYAGPEPEVPGNQSIRVQWNAPGNAGIPYYELDHYELQYSIDNCSNWLQYDPNVPVAGPLSVTVDISLSGLGMACGQNIKFRVNAKTVGGDNQYSDDSTAVNFFRYSTKPQDLKITDISFNPSNNNVGMTVNFKNPSDKGCGVGERFVVLINGQNYSGVGDLSYNPALDASYSIVYSNLLLDQVGDVKVYLRTQDTNSSELKHGQSDTVPYIANIVTLNGLDYEVYANGNDNQKMELRWSDPRDGLPAGSDWGVKYKVEKLNNENEQFLDVSHNLYNTVYTYDASGDAIDASANNMVFRVIATVTKSDVSYDIISNQSSKYTFKYAEAPTNAKVHWAVANESLSTMDVYVTFKNPDFLGVNNGPNNYEVKLLDASGNLLTTESRYIDFVNDVNHVYEVAFDNESYAASGKVRISLSVFDTNTDDVITFYASEPTYVSDELPVFIDVSYNNDNKTISGTIVSATPLQPIGQVIYPVGDEMYNKQISTNMDTTGMIINRPDEPNGPNDEYKYTFALEVTTATALTEVPRGLAILVANTVGVGKYIKKF